MAGTLFMRIRIPEHHLYQHWLRLIWRLAMLWSGGGDLVFIHSSGGGGVFLILGFQWFYKSNACRQWIL
jgi:hypothetical protein